MLRLMIGGLVWTGCSYGVSFEDCEVNCQTSSACPDDFMCMAGVCRAPGETGACAAPGSVTLRQTTDDKVERSLVFGCTNSDGTTPDTSWYRVFSLADAGITGNFDVTSVTVGVCFAVGTPAVDVKLGSYAGSANDTALDLAKVTTVKSTNVPIAATQISKTIDVPITGTVSGNVIVEVSTPDLDGTGNQINIGVTAASETHAGFLRSPLCGTANPVTTTAAGAPEAHLVLTVTGTR